MVGSLSQTEEQSVMAYERPYQAAQANQEPSQALPNDIYTYQYRLTLTKQKLKDAFQQVHMPTENMRERAVNLYSQVEELQGSWLELGKDPKLTRSELIPLAARTERIKLQLQEVESAVVGFSLETALIDVEYQDYLPFLAAHDAQAKLPLDPSYNIPSATRPRLIGADTAISELRQAVVEETRSHKIVSLCGIPGSGKTSTVLQFLDTSEVKETFGTVIWAEGKSLKAIDQQFCELATKISRSTRRFINSKAKLDFLLSKLSEETKPTLFVLDDFNGAIIYNDLAKCLPHNGHYTLLIIKETLEATYPRRNEQRVILPALDVEHATQLLLRTTNKDDLDPDNVFFGKRIVEKLSYHPLSIVSAGRSILQIDITFKEFEARFNKFYPVINRTERKQHLPSRALTAIWCMSLADLATENPAFVDHIRQMLLFCTFIHSDKINGSFGSLLLEGVPNPRPWTRYCLCGSNWRPELFVKMIRYLRRHALLEMHHLQDDAVGFSLQPYAREWLWYQETPERLVYQLFSAIECVLNGLEQYKRQESNSDTQDCLKLYARSILVSLQEIEKMKGCKRILKDYSEFVLTAKYKLISFLQKSLANSSDRIHLSHIPLLEQCLRAYQFNLGRSNPICIDISDHLGASYTSQGEFAKGEAVLRENLKYSKRSMSPSLAICLHQQGQLQEAHQACHKLTSHWRTERFSTEDYLRYLGQYTSEVLRSGTLSQADDILCTLDGLEPEGLEQSITKADIYIQLSNLYWCQSQQVDSIKIQLRGVKVYEDVLGPHDKRYLLVAHDMCRSFVMMQAWSSCNRLYKKVIAGYEVSHGSCSEKTNDARHSQAHALLELGHQEEGIEGHVLSLENLLLANSIDSQTTQEVFWCLAKHYHNHSKMSDLENLYLQTVSHFRESFNAKSCFQVILLRNLAKLYCHQTRWGAAQSLLNELITLRNIADSPSEDIVKDLKFLASVLHVQAKHSEAETIYRRILTLETESPASSHTSILSTILDLEQCCEKQGKTSEAQELRRTFIAASLHNQADKKPPTIPTTSRIDHNHHHAERRGEPDDDDDDDDVSDDRLAWDDDSAGDEDQSSLRQSRIRSWMHTSSDEPWLVMGMAKGRSRMVLPLPDSGGL